MKQLPRSPFTTPLSGSARETELRIRSIFQWKKQRPPLWAMVLIAALILTCGGLVSCQVQGGQTNEPATQSGEGWDTQAVLDALFQSSDASILSPGSIQSELLDSQGTSEDLTLAAGHFYDDLGQYSLLLGVVGRNGAETGVPFVVHGSGGRPYTAAFERGGSQYLLYTATWADQGFSGGEAGVIRLDGDDFTWVWPVEGDVRDSRSQAYKDYHDYWEGRKPLLAPSGVDIFTENQDYGIYEGSPVQWVPEQNEVFWHTAEENLPTGVYDQSRVWLEQFTRTGHNPWNARNTSALWQIVSLTPVDGVYRDRNDDREAVYELKARADNGEDLWFAASLLFDHSGERPIQVQHWSMGTKVEIDSASGQDNPQQLDEALYTLLQDWYNGQYPNDRWYFVTDQPDAPQEGDLRLGPVRFQGGGIYLNETTGEVYTVEAARYEDGQFHSLPAPYTLVLSRGGQDGSLQQVLGALALDTSGMTVEDIVLNAALGLMDAEAALRRDGSPLPLGPGGWTDLFRPAYDGEPEIQRLTSYEPIYHDGDYWDRWSVEGFSALRYYSAAEDRWSAHTIDVTRADLYTPRGIRVGASRAEVLAAYPEALTGDYWDQYPEEPDLLAYLPWSGHDPEQISDLSQLEFYQRLGPALLFFFDDSGQRVERITATRMDN